MYLACGTDNARRALKHLLCSYVGMPFDEYVRFFGFPETYDSMSMDPAWTAPVLPGMEDFAVQLSFAEAAALMETLKRDRLRKSLEEDRRMSQDDGVLLSDPEEEELRKRNDPWYTDRMDTIRQEKQDMVSDFISEMGKYSDDFAAWTEDGEDTGLTLVAEQGFFGLMGVLKERFPERDGDFPDVVISRLHFERTGSFTVCLKDIGELHMKPIRKE